jgi:hypothetical protein
MRDRTSPSRLFAVLGVVSIVAFAAPAHAAPPVLAQAGAASGTVAGTVKTADGTPLAGARITGQGPASASTVSDARGNFTLALPPGEYAISVTHGGFEPTTLQDIAVSAGVNQALAVTLTQESLNSLRTIGTTAATGRGSQINTGAATSNFVPAEAFTQLADPQINSVLQRIPDVTVEHLGSQQDTAIVVGGLQPYETQVLIDGHPIALGQYGVWLSHLFPDYLVGGVETQSGPGNTTPFANIAVGGTVNILTPGFTKATTAEFTTGVDTYASQYSNLLVSGSAGRLQYVAVVGTAGENGPYYKKQGCSVTEDYGTTANAPGSTGIVQFCGDMSGSLFTRADLLKINYNFTPSTSLELDATGSFGGYSPQGSAWGTSLGPTTIESCIAGTTQCTNPANANLVGSTINGYSWYPGTQINNSQQLYSAQFRTSLGSNTLLVRPYIGNIQPESYDGAAEGQYPSFFGPAPGTANYPGPPSLAAGVQIPSTGLANPNTFEATTCPVGNIFSYSQINSPQNTIVTKNGQEECFQYPYTFYEHDKLYGSTFSFIHPFGDNFVNLTYDFHGQSTFAYANAPSNVTVPFSATRFSTFSLTGALHPIENLTADFGLYDTLWTVNGSQALLDASGAPVTDANGNALTTGLDRSVSRFNPHIALVFRPHASDSIRLAWGTSETFPFVGDVSGTAAYQPPAGSAPLYTAGILTEKNPGLEPENSSEYDLGADHRFANGAVLSGDFQYSTVLNVFQQLELEQETTYNGAPALLGVNLPVNVARLRSQLLTLKYGFTPRYGVGYSVAAAADRSILDGIPLSAYNDSPSFPVNNVQLCGNGLFTPGLATCIPYLKGYAQMSYQGRSGDFLHLGIDYEGKNNAYYQPPFAQLDFTYRHPFSRFVDFQFSVQNLLNTNSFSDLPAPNAGEPLVAATVNGQTTYASTLIPENPRTARFQLRFHLGR